MILSIRLCVNDIFTCFAMLGSVDSWLVTDVWGQPVGPIFLDYLTLEDGSDRLPRNVGNCKPIYAADTPEDRRSNLMHF